MRGVLRGQSIRAVETQVRKIAEEFCLYGGTHNCPGRTECQARRPFPAYKCTREQPVLLVLS